MRNHKILQIVTLSLLLIALTFPAQAHSQPSPPFMTIMSAQSVGVLSEDPGYGERWSTSIFPFGNYTGTVSGVPIFCRTYLRFPLDGIPAIATIQAATLYVYVDDYWPGPGSAPISVYPAAVDWTPDGVDWYNAGAWPALGGATATTVVSSNGGWFTWDVTGLVQEWVSGARPNYGLALAAADLNSAASNWAAARRLTANDPVTLPYLAVNFNPSPTVVSQPTAVPQTTVPPQPVAPTTVPVPTPTLIPILLPETGAQSMPFLAGPALAACGALLLLLACSRLRRR